MANILKTNRRAEKEKQQAARNRREIIAAAESVGGVEFYLMEQEGSRYGEFETAKRCLETWKAMRQEG